MNRESDVLQQEPVDPVKIRPDYADAQKNREIARRLKGKPECPAFHGRTRLYVTGRTNGREVVCPAMNRNCDNPDRTG